MEIKVGAILDGSVKSITKFGAFVLLPGGRSGLVHISEIAHSYVSDVKDHLKEGQEVRVKVVDIDDAGRINLSIKKAMDPPPPAQNQGPRGGQGQFAPRGGQGQFTPRSGNGQFPPKGNSGGQFAPRGGHGFQNRGSFEPRSQVHNGAAQGGGNDFDQMVKSFLQSSDSKLSTMRAQEKRSSRRSGHH